MTNSFEISYLNIFHHGITSSNINVHVLSRDFAGVLRHRHNTLLIHTKRIGNTVAHSLSRLAFSSLDSVWIQEVPLEIQTLVDLDLRIVLASQLKKNTYFNQISDILFFLVYLFKLYMCF